MDIIDTVREQLVNYPGVRYEIVGRTIQVSAVSVDGFVVSLSQASSGCTLNFEGWHEEFESATEAMNCFLFGLSEKCRLKVVKRGVDHKWVVQEQKDGQWRDFSAVGLLLFPFWCRPRERYLQNHFTRSV